MKVCRTWRGRTQEIQERLEGTNMAVESEEASSIAAEPAFQKKSTLEPYPLQPYLAKVHHQCSRFCEKGTREGNALRTTVHRSSFFE